VSMRASQVDRCRLLTVEGTAQKVEGSTVAPAISGNWVRCRYLPGGASEAAFPGDPESRRTIENARLLVGSGTEVSARDRIEVAGEGTFEVVGVEPVRRRKRTIVHILTLARAAE
jgi:hypothetical protein